MEEIRKYVPSFIITLQQNIENEEVKKVIIETDAVALQDVLIDIKGALLGIGFVFDGDLVVEETEDTRSLNYDG